jgi:hypothetical protein
MAVDTATLVRLALSPPHGDTMVSPRPLPTSTKTAVSVDAAKAPAKIGPQETAGFDDSIGATLAAVAGIAMKKPLSA